MIRTGGADFQADAVIVTGNNGNKIAPGPSLTTLFKLPPQGRAVNCEARNKCRRSARGSSYPNRLKDVELG
jgi:hypothetical protein